MPDDVDIGDGWGVVNDSIAKKAGINSVKKEDQKQFGEQKQENNQLKHDDGAKESKYSNPISETLENSYEHKLNDFFNILF